MKILKKIKKFFKTKNDLELEKFQIINKCETTEELKNAIVKISDKNGYIQGRFYSFDAYKMKDRVDLVIDKNYPANYLTRSYGIRQQALYIKYYLDKKYKK